MKNVNVNARQVVKYGSFDFNVSGSGSILIHIYMYYRGATGLSLNLRATTGVRGILLLESNSSLPLQLHNSHHSSKYNTQNCTS